MTGRRDSRGAVTVVRVLAARPKEAPGKTSVFSSSSRCLASASFLFLKKNNANAKTAPKSSNKPIAIPAFPPALKPPDWTTAVGVEVALAALAAVVDGVFCWLKLLVAARSGIEEATDDDTVGTMEEGRPVELCNVGSATEEEAGRPVELRNVVSATRDEVIFELELCAVV